MPISGVPPWRPASMAASARLIRPIGRIAGLATGSDVFASQSVLTSSPARASTMGPHPNAGLLCTSDANSGDRLGR